MIYDEHKLIQIAIPKTGTSCVFKTMHNMPVVQAEANILINLNMRSIDPMFEYYKHGHILYKDYEKMIANNPRYNDYKFFTFTRNPFNIMVSQYLFKGHIFTRARSTKTKQVIIVTQTFKQFLTSILTEPDAWVTQTDYLKNKKGNINIDFIGKLENIEEGWKQLRRLSDSVPEYNKKYRDSNKSLKRRFLKNPLGFSELYCEETKEMVLSYFKEDFETFNYEKSLSVPDSCFAFPKYYVDDFEHTYGSYPELKD